MEPVRRPRTEGLRCVLRQTTFFEVPATAGPKSADEIADLERLTENASREGGTTPRERRHRRCWPDDKATTETLGSARTRRLLVNPSVCGS